MWQIAQRDYKFGKGKHRSLTQATYDAVGNHFRSLWGQEAGWAHTVLFTADLRAFSERLTAKVEVLEVKKEEDESRPRVEAHIEAHVNIKSEIKLETEDSKKRLLDTDEATAKAKTKRTRRT